MAVHQGGRLGQLLSNLLLLLQLNSRGGRTCASRPSRTEVPVTRGLEHLPLDAGLKWSTLNDSAVGQLVRVPKCAGFPDRRGVMQGWGSRVELVATNRAQPHPFVAAALAAWSAHRPLVLAPDHFWQLILGGVVAHMEQHSEELRAAYVTFEGELTLQVQRDEFVLDGADNDWNGVVQEFVDQIQQHVVSDTITMLEANFSTTGPVETVAQKASVMAAVQAFFKYEVLTMCGFPHVVLEGEPGDWAQLRTKARWLLQSDKIRADFGAQWLAAMEPVLNLLARSAAEPNSAGLAEFWNQMVRIGGVEGSGGYSYLDGWANVFLPYWGSESPNVSAVPNPYCFRNRSRSYIDDDDRFSLNSISNEEVSSTGPLPAKLELMPDGRSVAPVQWTYFGDSHDLAFVSGFIGFSAANARTNGGLPDNPKSAMVTLEDNHVSTTKPIGDVAATTDTTDTDGEIRPELGWYVARRERLEIRRDSTGRAETLARDGEF